MAEYIERENPLRQMQNSKVDKPNYGDWDIAHDCCIDIVKNIPAADVVEVVHGEWKDDRFIKGIFPSVRCSECNIRFCDIINNHQCMWNYCPNCGAYMRGKNNG